MPRPAAPSSKHQHPFRSHLHVSVHTVVDFLADLGEDGLLDVVDEGFVDEVREDVEPLFGGGKVRTLGEFRTSGEDGETETGDVFLFVNKKRGAD